MNATVGDLEGNAAKVLAAWTTPKPKAPIFMWQPELFITGYPPEDLVLKPAFQAAARRAVEALPQRRPTAPHVSWAPSGSPRPALQRSGPSFGRQDRAGALQVDLPNYGVFDEKRVFTAGSLPSPITVKGVRIVVPTSVRTSGRTR